MTEVGVIQRGTLPGGKPGWQITARPDVIVRIKRLLPRARADRAGVVVVSDTPETCRDLEWLAQRYGFRMSEASRAHLIAQADADRDREEKVARILAGGGGVPLADTRPPIRAPRPYQQAVADMVLTTGRVLCTDPLGAGKTMSSLLALQGEDALPALVVTLTGRMPEQWCEEVAKTFPWLRTHIARKGTPYDPTTLRGVDGPPDVLVMNYAKLAGWRHHLAGKVRTVIFDEVQELRHAHTEKGRAAAHIADQARYRLGLSNTPIFGYGGEVYDVVSVLAPDLLGTRDEYLLEWCRDIGNGKHVVKDPEALGAFLRAAGLLLDRDEKELGIVLPEVERNVVHVDTDPKALEDVQGDAREMARLLLDPNSSPWSRRQAAGRLDLVVRQATGVAKAPYVAEYVRFLLESEERVMLYGWHRSVYDIWLDRLADFDPVLYTGSESNVQKNRTFRSFTEGTSRLLIMSLRSGAGIDGLQQHCRDVVFGELDWAPNVHRQAIGRLRRAGMDVTRPTRSHYLIADEGSDPTIAKVHGLKSDQHDRIFTRNVQAATQSRTAQDAERMKDLARAVLGEQPTAVSA